MTKYAVWTQGLDKERQDAIVNQLNNNSVLFNRLLLILNNKMESVDTKMMAEDNFNLPGWDYRNAFHLGRKKGIKEVIDLFDFLLTERK